MISEQRLYTIEEIFDAALLFISDMLPSEWTEANRVMTTDESPFPGRFSYDKTPYCREIADCAHPSHPSRKIAVQKGGQIGFSAGVIEAVIGWIISQSPGNILFLTGHSDLSEEAVAKIDSMIDNSGIRNLIRPSKKSKRNNKTGDTNTSKEFPGGKLVSGSAGNHKMLRQRSVRYGFIDDFEAAKNATKESGSTRRMIEQRFAAYYTKMKLFYISTPEVKATSNIEPAFLLGDQRRYHIPCPCCGELIALYWQIDVEGSDGRKKGGIAYELDAENKAIPESVGYICQKCGGFFDDKNKMELLQAGRWIATAVPKEPDFYSYHISSLYAPPGMYDWRYYVNQYLEANPPGEAQKKDLHQAFVNLVLGETYEEETVTNKATAIMSNKRPYEIGEVPDKMSINDGNGPIVLLTLAADLNGTEDDARLDYEVLAHATSGATYSITHGSIGTFVPREGQKKFKEDRERFTYHHFKDKSVWPILEQVIKTKFKVDSGRPDMSIGITGIDTGHYTQHAYSFLDQCPGKGLLNVYGLKGKDVDRYQKLMRDAYMFSRSKERSKDLYMVDVNHLKDDLSVYMNLRWDSGNDDRQPPNFMNFPYSANGLYEYTNYFSHFEAEKCESAPIKEGQSPAMRWVKINTNVQNHMWDCRVYNLVLRDILVDLIGTQLKEKNFSWSDFCAIINQKR